MNKVLIGIITTMLLAAQCGMLRADLKADVGYSKLAAELGDALPTGSGVSVAQVEGESSAGYWMPDADNAQFNGKTIKDKTGGGGVSGHATAVGAHFYGTKDSMAPGISNIEVYVAATKDNNHDWMTLGYLMAWLTIDANPLQPMYYSSPNQFLRILAAPLRIANHSWVSANTNNSDILRRLDFVTEADDFVQVAALNNGAAHRPLLSGAFNAITIGRTDGNHPTGTMTVDEVYTAGRTCPLIVVPVAVTSTAAPVVASAAALLIEAARDTDLANDPQQTHVVDRSGRAIVNAERAETIKAALLSGAQRSTGNTSSTAQITDYRRDIAHRSRNGLDARFGAGQLDLYNSYHIIASGEQNSDEDQPGRHGGIDALGFDVDPYFGGLSGSNTTGTYTFTADARRLYVSLVWHLDIDGGVWNRFDNTATIYNLDLALYDTTNGIERLVDRSVSIDDNTENLWTAIIPGRRYRLEVYRAADQRDFLWDYALAWRSGTPPDTDGDGIDDEWEVQFGLDYANADDAALDDDADGLSALQEYLLGTDIGNMDTDGDSASDGDEAASGSDPLDPDDLPGPNPPLSMPAAVATVLALIGIGRYFFKRAVRH